MTKRKRYSAEFKRHAVELLESQDRSGVEVARELGVRQNQLYKWREELKPKATGPSRAQAVYRKIRRMKWAV
jgi:transposase